MRLRKIAFCRSVLGAVTACTFMVCCVSGCGSPGAPATLSGNVSFDGQPVADGTIKLVPSEGTPGGGGAGKITDGAYSLSGDTLKSGKHDVVIFGFRGTGNMIEEEGAEPEDVGAGDEDGDAPAAAEPAAPGEPVMVEEREQFIPEKYNRDSTEVIDLAAGGNSKDYDLQP